MYNSKGIHKSIRQTALKYLRDIFSKLHVKIVTRHFLKTSISLVDTLLHISISYNNDVEILQNETA